MRSRYACWEAYTPLWKLDVPHLKRMHHYYTRYAMHHLGARLHHTCSWCAMISLDASLMMYGTLGCSGLSKDAWKLRMLDVNALNGMKHHFGGEYAIMMEILYHDAPWSFLMSHLGSVCSIMCVANSQAMYLYDEGSRSDYMADCDWLKPFMGLWINRLGPLGF